MKKLLMLMLCFVLTLTAGCGKTDEEKLTELTDKFRQEFRAADSKEQKDKLAEEYKSAVPKSKKVNADSVVISEHSRDDMDKYKGVKFGNNPNAEMAHYPTN